MEREESSHMEIVKLSSSSALLLNRPFINILCQVSFIHPYYQNSFTNIACSYKNETWHRFHPVRVLNVIRE